MAKKEGQVVLGILTTYDVKKLFEEIPIGKTAHEKLRYAVSAAFEKYHTQNPITPSAEKQAGEVKQDAVCCNVQGVQAEQNVEKK